jgi:hypothetical protein
MPTARQTASLMSRPIASYALLAVSYCVLTLLLPVNHTTLQAYNLTTTQYRITQLLVIIPSLTIWFVAFLGYARFRQYASVVRTAREGGHFRQLARGCTWLAWSLPISAIATLILSAIGVRWPSLHATAIIISNYINLALPLIAFSLIGSASRGLVSDARLRFSLTNARVIMFGFLAAGVLYCYLVFRRLDLSSLGSTHNPFFLPIWLTVFTIIIPYLYVWFIGVLAAYEIAVFSKHTRGVLYRRAMSLLIGGLIAVIASSIALQYLNGVQPRLDHLVINYRLVLVVLFQCIAGIGFVLMAIGATRLKRIEEV